MGVQRKLSDQSGLTSLEKNLIGNILDLEKKYQAILWNLFTSADFISDLIDIETYIISNYSLIKSTYKLKNILKTGAERLARHHIYSNLNTHGINVLGIYPSPISGDIGLIFDDIVLSLDIKTIDTVGNSSDVFHLQFLPNQSSFKNNNLDSDPNIPSSGVVVESLLPQTFRHDGIDKPVLTYFLKIIYSDNNTGFSLNRNSKYFTIHLSNLPNGITSRLFDFDIVDNFKTYNYLKAPDFRPVLLLRNSNFSSANQAVYTHISTHPDLQLIQGRTKIGAFNPNTLHPRYGTIGVSWFPVSRKRTASGQSINDFFLEAVNYGDTSRVMNNKLQDRFDSNDNPWNGMLKIKI